MEYMIRKMNENDFKQVQQVATTSWHDTYDGIIPLNIQDNFLKLAYNDSQLQNRLDRSIFFVAEVDGKIVGFANYSYSKEKGMVELISIYLLKEYQGKGIGTSLLNEAIDTIEGMREIYVNVEKENTTGITFYQAKGFKIISAFDDDFDGHLLKTVRMVLNV